MANYFSEVLHGKSIAGAKKLNSAKISLYITPGGHYYCYALYMHKICICNVSLVVLPTALFLKGSLQPCLRK